MTAVLTLVGVLYVSPLNITHETVIFNVDREKNQWNISEQFLIVCFGFGLF